MTESVEAKSPALSDDAGARPAAALLGIAFPREKRVVHNPKGGLSAEVPCCEDLSLIRSRETKEPNIGLIRRRNILCLQPTIFVIDKDCDSGSLEVKLVASVFSHQALKCNAGV